MTNIFKHLFVTTALVASVGTAVAAPAQAPNDFIKTVADGLINRLKAEHGQLQNNPAAVNAIVKQNLEPYVDVQAFTRIVMGTYASPQNSTPQQRATFERSLRQSLIQNYGSALAKYSDQSYAIRPYRPSASAYQVVTLDFVNQGQKTPVAFQLGDSNNQWKIRNINVAGIDLGLQFRNQFASSVQRSGGDLDKAIASFQPDADAAVKK
ncbi:ABC transporter substrate-binding protein [Acinetobacter sp. B5B]|uniref:MlaC/ttg2D family ABC transporter substrate-binding protein n=1 Tax=Acinetobacter baretiae TaxID=2605383 RepID=UPI0018C2E3D3|nr:ABC transporter substrate-binding protein [Acinetobacter baretiae]MBF7684182.1 ABC transporter substrate-binding protein [Acinetobacter baretiae]MBF7686597.1 ABC transporter substrate-binding protein [Acinetobacter baretiae]